MPPRSAPVKWNEALAGYATAQRAAGRSSGTIRLHAHYLSGLASSEPRPWTVDRADLLDALDVEGWAPETRKSARGALRGFYRWGHGMGYIDHDPSDTLPPVTIPPPSPRPTPEHLVAQLVRRDDRIGFMAQLAGYAGLRAAEIAQVHARDVLGDELLVHGKGRKERVVPIVHRGLLRRLLDLEPGAWAFPNGKGFHLSPGHVTRLLSAELPDGWTAHTLRHRCATQMYAGTRDLLSVGQILGHSRPETTQRYVLLPDDALRAALACAAG